VVLGRFVVAVGIIVVTGFAYGAEVSGPQNLVLKIELGKERYLLYEPVTVRYSVENPTASQIVAGVVMHDSTGHLELSITNQAGETWRYAGRGAANVVVPQTLHPPGSVMLSETDLSWNARATDWAFPSPGVYGIQAKMWAGSDRGKAVVLTSNTVEIHVVTPSGKDAEAIEFLGRDAFLLLQKDGPWGFCEGREGPGCFEELRTFLRRYSISAYAPSIVWHLGAAVEHGLVELTPKEQQAIELYRMFLGEWPTHPNAPRVMYGLALLLNESGRHREASDLRAEFERMFPEQKNRREQLAAEIRAE